MNGFVVERLGGSFEHARDPDPLPEELIRPSKHAVSVSLIQSEYRIVVPHKCSFLLIQTRSLHHFFRSLELPFPGAEGIQQHHSDQAADHWSVQPSQIAESLKKDQVVQQVG